MTSNPGKFFLAKPIKSASESSVEIKEAPSLEVGRWSQKLNIQIDTKPALVQPIGNSCKGGRSQRSLFKGVAGWFSDSNPDLRARAGQDFGRVKCSESACRARLSKVTDEGIDISQEQSIQKLETNSGFTGAKSRNYSFSERIRKQCLTTFNTPKNDMNAVGFFQNGPRQ